MYSLEKTQESPKRLASVGIFSRFFFGFSISGTYKYLKGASRSIAPGSNECGSLEHCAIALCFSLARYRLNRFSVVVLRSVFVCGREPNLPPVPLLPFLFVPVPPFHPLLSPRRCLCGSFWFSSGSGHALIHVPPHTGAQRNLPPRFIQDSPCVLVIFPHSS